MHARGSCCSTATTGRLFVARQLASDPALKSHFRLLAETPSRINGPRLGYLWSGFWVWHFHVRSFEERGSQEQNPRVRGAEPGRGRSCTLMKLLAGLQQSREALRGAAGPSHWPCLEARGLRTYAPSWIGHWMQEAFRKGAWSWARHHPVC